MTRATGSFGDPALSLTSVLLTWLPLDLPQGTPAVSKDLSIQAELTVRWKCFLVEAGDPFSRLCAATVCLGKEEASGSASVGLGALDL